jgi:hypothetical protein
MCAPNGCSAFLFNFIKFHFASGSAVLIGVTNHKKRKGNAIGEAPNHRQ